MTRGTVAKRRRRAVAYVLYDETGITGIACVKCAEPEDPRRAPIRDAGAVRCDRCGKVCR